ncbi:LytR/AlgR family response regulator transcription factor [Fodinibius halophilus]|uniref:Response regulator transcription factor n=1 Tax=Fodinibius halophilus TaxID=1736908 RepID=A0A6M1TFT7_9BACT|nr:LytTR family DNA-binding domain-containing protein [Fodinibius halophilus]NGP89654.1 response regulator transcription factor [Fodinibius halophilus]
MKNYRAVIIDDEPPARDVILEYIEDINWIDVVQSVGNPHKGLDYLNNHEVDVLFLDIQMPQMTGFELVNRLDELPYIIFSTAYDEYAIHAFDINAVDYLLKPYTKARFNEAITRVQKIAGQDDTRQERIRALLKQVDEKEKYPDRLFVRSRDQIIPVEVDDIQWIEAEGDYSRIHYSEGKVLCGKGIGKLLKQLNPSDFVRVHRSYAIALSALENLEPDGHGGFMATLEGETQVKVSRSYANRIKNIII